MKKMEYTTNVIAGAAVTSPFWLSGLREVSVVAGYLVPIFGLVWLAVQIVNKVNEMVREKAEREDSR